MSKRTFRIWVAGGLKDGFAKGLDPDLDQEIAEANTALSGELVDQAQLQGLLQRLSSLGVEVIRFETYPPAGGEHPSPGDNETDDHPQSSSSRAR